MTLPDRQKLALQLVLLAGVFWGAFLMSIDKALGGLIFALFFVLGIGNLLFGGV